MLCRRCRCRLARGAAVCDACGEPLSGEIPPPLELVLPDGTRVALVGELVLGRGQASDVQLSDPTVSRKHARIDGSGPFPVVEDLGSSYGSLLDARPLQGTAPLRDGAVLVLGDCELHVERARSHEEAGRTIVVRAGQTVVLDANGTTEIRSIRGDERNRRPRLRSGYSLKRLGASEGPRRWVLKDERDGNLVRMGDEEAALLQLLDGRRDVGELVAEAEQRLGPGRRGAAGDAGRRARRARDARRRRGSPGAQGPAGPAAAAAPARLDPARGRLRHRLPPRRWILFTTPVLLLLAAVAVGGVGGLGLPDRRALRHALRGREPDRPRRADLPRRPLPGGGAARAGPRTDRGLVRPAGAARRVQAAPDLPLRLRGHVRRLVRVAPAADGDQRGRAGERPDRRRRLRPVRAGRRRQRRAIFFQLALAAYVGAFFNLNPLIDRDGYQLLVDALRAPGLRRRSRERFAAILSGRPRPGGASRALVTYAVASLGWSLSLVGFAILVPVLYWDRLTMIQPPEVIVGVLVVVYAVMLLPVALIVGRPLLSRLGRGEARAA